MKYFLERMNTVVLLSPLNSLCTQVTSGNMGWAPDYSLHPMQWNFSGKEGPQSPPSPVDLRMPKSYQFGPSKDSGDGSTIFQVVSPPLLDFATTIV